MYKLLAPSRNDRVIVNGAAVPIPHEFDTRLPAVTRSVYGGGYPRAGGIVLR